MSQDIESQSNTTGSDAKADSVDSSYVFNSKAFQVWYGINGLASIVTPVALTMLLTSILVSAVRPTGFVESLQEGMNVYMVFKDTTTDTSTAIWQAIINAVVMILGIGCLTFIIVLLYKYHCIKVLYGLLYFSTFCALGYTGGFIVYMWLSQYKIISDYISLIFIFYNFGVGGVIAIFYGWVPKIIVKIYLVLISVIVGYLLSFFPYWTTWCLLVCLAAYDMLAVLTPCGPLKLLVNEAKNRDDPIPGLLYEAELNGGMSSDDEVYDEELLQEEPGMTKEEYERLQRALEQSVAEYGNLSSDMQMKIAKEKLRLEDARNQPIAAVTASPVATTATNTTTTNTTTTNTTTANTTAIDAASTTTTTNASTSSATVVPAPTGSSPVVSASETSAPVSSTINTNTLSTETSVANQEIEGTKQPGTDCKENEETTIDMADYEEEEEEENQPSIYSRESVHLGLGDFIFYSLLVTTAGYYSIVPYIACFVIIIAGLLMTMALLSILERALPALPFSMILGVTVYFVIYYTCVDMMNSFAVEGYLF